MNKEELANKVFDSIEKNMKENKINIYSAYESLLDSLNTKTDIAEPLLEFYLSFLLVLSFGACMHNVTSNQSLISWPVPDLPGQQRQVHYLGKISFRNSTSS